MDARLIVVAGMGFGSEIGKYSKDKLRSISVKRKKLTMGKALLEWLANRTSVLLYDVTSGSEGIRGFLKITSREILTLL